MGTSVLDGRPTPGAEIGRFLRFHVLVHCSACSRGTRVHIGRMLKRHRLSPGLTFFRLEERLRCLTCGGPGRIIEVEGWKR